MDLVGRLGLTSQAAGWLFWIELPEAAVEVLEVIADRHKNRRAVISEEEIKGDINRMIERRITERAIQEARGEN